VTPCHNRPRNINRKDGPRNIPVPEKDAVVSNKKEKKSGIVAVGIGGGELAQDTQEKSGQDGPSSVKKTSKIRLHLIRRKIERKQKKGRKKEICDRKDYIVSRNCEVKNFLGGKTRKHGPGTEQS